MFKKKFIVVAGLTIFLAGAFLVSADHSWGGYHWGRTVNPFTLELGNNVSAKWFPHLSTAAADWSLSSILDTVVATGKAGNPRVCKAKNGRIEICSATYGFNGWLGLAQIWVSGGHIIKGVTKVNDTYFNTATYDKPEWRNLVMCQEIGHTIGLGHVDENFYNEPLGTCMDYSADPTLNQHPNAHDYEMLETIYAHLDGVSTVGFSDAGGNFGNSKGKQLGVEKETNSDNPSEWGQSIRKDAQGKNSLFVRDLDKDEKLFTFVIWTK